MQTIFITNSFTVQSQATLVENDSHYQMGMNGGPLSAHCEVTGRSPGFGNAVSHSHRRTRRRWSPNIQLKTYYLPSEDRRIKLRVSTKGMKVIDRDGIEAVVARLRAQGRKF
ncbi:50S ribosomal protein L28-2 [Mycobacteroides abscessus subsp. bolletii]|jgi:large subunit ribosomal protein L28|nr:50S ribosomal protein L28-2 [Mycobacteroides abscessus subsp. bolletii]